MEEIKEMLEKDDRIIKFKEKKKELLNDKDLIFKINKLKELDKYKDEYKKMKLEVFKDSDFVQYKQLENEIALIIMEINNKLKTLIDKDGTCRWE